jgi:PIN domain
MSTSYLLDSSVLVLSLKKDLAIRQRLANATTLYISAVALGELYYGAEHSTQVKRNSAEVDELAQATTILTYDHATAKSMVISSMSRVPGDSYFLTMISGLPQQQSNMDSHLPHVTGILCGLLDLTLNSGSWKRRFIL